MGVARVLSRRARVEVTCILATLLLAPPPSPLVPRGAILAWLYVPHDGCFLLLYRDIHAPLIFSHRLQQHEQLKAVISISFC